MSQKKKIREGPLPPADNASSTRSDILRGAPFQWAQGDTRPGLPVPSVRKDVIWTRPQPTTSTDSGFQLNPENPTAGKLPRLPQPYARPGNSPTSTPGFGKISPSGTGLPDQAEAALRRLRNLRRPTQ